MYQNIKNKIGLHTATAVVVGSIIGSGIFMKPASMAAQTGSAPILIAVWLAGGLISLCGALIFAELSAMFPETGGLYVFLKKMYGNFPAFLFGWSSLTVINTAAVAAIAFVCAAYANHFLHLPGFNEATVQSFAIPLPFLGTLYPLDKVGVKALAVAIVLGLSWLNARSLHGGGLLQLVSTLIKVAAIVILVFGIFLSGNGSVENLFSKSADAPGGIALLSAVMAALTGAFVAYDGWQNISFMGGEVENPQKNLPRSIIFGVVSCTLIYVLITLAFAFALPVDVMARSPLVATDAMEAMLGSVSGSVVAALIVIVTFGAVNGNIMATTRVTLAMAHDGYFFRSFGELHASNQTPSKAIWLHATWCCVLIMSGSFDMLADMFIFVTWMFIIVACVGMAILRKKNPAYPRPYKMWGYPWLLILFTAFALFYVGSTIDYEITQFAKGKVKTINSLLGLSITCAGIPLYLYFSNRRKKNG